MWLLPVLDVSSKALRYFLEELITIWFFDDVRWLSPIDTRYISLVKWKSPFHDFKVTHRFLLNLNFLDRHQSLYKFPFLASFHYVFATINIFSESGQYLCDVITKIEFNYLQSDLMLDVTVVCELENCWLLCVVIVHFKDRLFLVFMGMLETDVLSLNTC